MKKHRVSQVCVIILVFAFKSSLAQVQYPASRKMDIANNYFGITVEDPYRWLEFESTDETRDWINQQNKTTETYLDKIPFRAEIREKLQKRWNYPKYNSPTLENGIYYFFKNEGLQNQPVFYSQKDLKSEPEVFLDPNTFSQTGDIAIADVIFSKKAKYCAYTTTNAGSDWRIAHVMDVATKKILDDKLEWIKFSNISWKGDEGFYYSRYPVPKGNGRWTNEDRYHAIYFHKVGQPQSEDRLVFEDREQPYQVHTATVTEDDRYLILNTTEGSNTNQLMVRNINKNDDEPFRMILQGFKYEAEVFDNDKKFLYVKTNVSAPRYRVVAVSLSNPFVNNWETLIPEQKEVMEDIVPCGGSWFASYLKDASNTISQFTMGGYKLRDLELPAVNAATIYRGHLNDDEFFYSYSTFFQPRKIFMAKVSNGKSNLFKGSDLPINASDFETKQIFFNSEDGTRVPMFISYKKGMKPDGQNPLLLNGFGGFNKPLKADFNMSNLFFMEQGGIYAQVNTRGGSEFGEKWHLAGMLFEKQNVFDDFMGAAQYLVDENYTNPKKLAITGTDNGGLLVGASMVQQPELFRVAIPEVGILDMLRYQKFTSGNTWVSEFGSSEDRDEFDNIYSYSPLHNLKSGVEYPATLIITADKDDRVVPAHSFKFTARLQEVQKGENPALLRVDINAGHGKGKPAPAHLEEQVDKLSFLMYQLGMTPR